MDSETTRLPRSDQQYIASTLLFKEIHSLDDAMQNLWFPTALFSYVDPRSQRICSERLSSVNVEFQCVRSCVSSA